MNLNKKKEKEELIKEYRKEHPEEFVEYEEDIEVDNENTVEIEQKDLDKVEENDEKEVKSSLLNDASEVTKQETRTGKINEERNKIVEIQKEKTQSKENEEINKE